MSLERTCTLCHGALNSRPFWDNLCMHKDCLDKVVAAVRISPAGEVKIKEKQDAES